MRNLPDSVRPRQVLLDSFGLQICHGAGLGSYSRMVLDSLRRLGLGVGHLLSVPAMTRSALPRLLNDPPVPGGRLRMASLLARHVLYRGRAHLLGDGPNRRTAELPDWIAPGDRLFVSPHCYRLAMGMSQLRRGTLTVRPAEPVDVWHQIFPMPIRVRARRQIVTVADLIPLRLPWTTRIDAEAFRQTVQAAVDRADAVATLSEHSRSELCELIDVPEHKVHVTYCCTTPGPELDADAGRRRVRELGLEPGGYLLFVGSIEPRKNLSRLLEAVARVGADVPLVLAGQPLWRTEEILRAGKPLSDRGLLKHLGWITDEDRAALYANALMLTWPSLYEGFGLPPLEAMHHGCPVLTSSSTSLPEVCGQAAVYVDPESVEDIAEKLSGLLGDEALRRRLAREGPIQARRFNAQAFDGRMARLYEQALSD